MMSQSDLTGLQLKQQHEPFIVTLGSNLKNHQVVDLVDHPDIMGRYGKYITIKSPLNHH